MRSDTIKKGFEHAPHRSLLRATGVIQEESDFERPFIGIANSYTDLIPGHVHLQEFGKIAKQAIREAGGVPFEFNTIGVDDGIAMLKVKVGGEIEHTVADGNGPVNALNNAIKKALVRFFPELEQIKLTDYKVRVLNEQDGTSAKVRVLIESSDGNESWSTIGVSENIIVASWEALRDSFNYRLFKIHNSIKERSLIKS